MWTTNHKNWFDVYHRSSIFAHIFSIIVRPFITINHPVWKTRRRFMMDIPEVTSSFAIVPFVAASGSPTSVPSPASWSDSRFNPGPEDLVGATPVPSPSTPGKGVVQGGSDLGFFMVQCQIPGCDARMMKHPSKFLGVQCVLCICVFYRGLGNGVQCSGCFLLVNESVTLSICFKICVHSSHDSPTFYFIQLYPALHYYYIIYIYIVYDNLRDCVISGSR